MSLSATRPSASVRAAGRDLWQLGVLPVLALGALSGLLGVYWDIAWHIDKGRDSFFTPPHNFIYSAILATLFASLYGLLRDRRATALHLPLGRARLHPGLLIVAVAAALDLFFAPADELWHRLFGIDVTLWAPMHLIGLSALTLLAFGGLVTSWLERALSESARRQRFFARLTVAFAALLLALMGLWLAEYEFNVPAFPMFWHPLLLTGLPVLLLVLMAWLKPVPWAATWTALGFSALRLGLAGALMATASFDLAGLTRPAIPLLLLGGLAADLLVTHRLPLWLTGLVLGAVGFLSNYALVLATGELNWYPAALLVGVPAGLALAVALAYLGDAVAGALGAAQPPAGTAARRA